MAKYKLNMEKEKKFIWGQYFTKVNVIEKIIDLLQDYKEYDKDIKIFEPSSGTGNFVKVLKERGFNKIVECEIDPELTKNPSDFFEFPLTKKFDLIIGNPPFTKYNVKNSYYYSENYQNKEIKPEGYLTKNLLKKPKIQMENVFILKSIKHLKEKDSSIAFVLPISFFIAKKNKDIKKELINNFSTIIIYQNDKNWFDEPIPCCFAIFTNTKEYKDKIFLLYEDGGKVSEILNISDLLKEELIPKSFLYKKNNHQEGTPLSEFLSQKRVKYQRDYNKNNISGANILQRNKVPEKENVEDYSLAIVRVGNSSVGKVGLINVKTDVLNDMFFVFEFNDKYKTNKELKERICSEINKNQEHFKNSTIRVGSKSIKKSDVFNFKIQEL